MHIIIWFAHCITQLESYVAICVIHCVQEAIVSKPVRYCSDHCLVNKYQRACTKHYQCIFSERSWTSRDLLFFLLYGTLWPRPEFQTDEPGPVLQQHLLPQSESSALQFPRRQISRWGTSVFLLINKNTPRFFCNFFPRLFYPCFLGGCQYIAVSSFTYG
jgi:hypothetical protein